MSPAENGSSSAAGVTITGKSFVLPARSPEKPTCPLSTFDLPYITFYYNQKLLLYKFAGEDEEEEEFRGVVARLKEGLAAALSEFYPLAGRIVRDNDSGDGELVVDCGGRDGGVEVVEAVVEWVAVDELAEVDELAAEMMAELVPYGGVMNLEGLCRPLLALQFTKLKDGIAIGCAFNHAVLDGNSTWHFMSSWADLCRRSGSGGDAGVSLAPFHDRAAACATRVKLDLPATAAAHEELDPNGPPKPLRAKIFSFSSASVEKLKSLANASLAADPISAFQALGAHVWRAVCRARGLKPEDITVFAVFVDCRKRVDPPLPDGYFGNLIQAIFTATAAGLLQSGPPEFGAGLLRTAIGSHDATAVAARLEEYEAKPKLFYFSDAGANTVAVGSSPRFPVYDVDFGFGRPARVRSGPNNKFDGMMYLYPGRGGGRSVDVELTLDPAAMENLVANEEFLKVGD